MDNVTFVIILSVPTGIVACLLLFKAMNMQHGSHTEILQRDERRFDRIRKSSHVELQDNNAYDTEFTNKLERLETKHRKEIAQDAKRNKKFVRRCRRAVHRLVSVNCTDNTGTDDDTGEYGFKHKKHGRNRR